MIRDAAGAIAALDQSDPNGFSLNLSNAGLAAIIERCSGAETADYGAQCGSGRFRLNISMGHDSSYSLTVSFMDKAFAAAKMWSGIDRDQFEAIHFLIGLRESDLLTKAGITPAQRGERS